MKVSSNVSEAVLHQEVLGAEAAMPRSSVSKCGVCESCLHPRWKKKCAADMPRSEAAHEEPSPALDEVAASSTSETPQGVEETRARAAALASPTSKRRASGDAVEGPQQSKKRAARPKTIAVDADARLAGEQAREVVRAAPSCGEAGASEAPFSG